MAEKCELCREKIEETFLGKLNGTIVIGKRNSKDGKAYVCNECQSEHKDKLKEMINN